MQLLPPLLALPPPPPLPVVSFSHPSVPTSLCADVMLSSPQLLSMFNATN